MKEDGPTQRYTTAALLPNESQSFFFPVRFAELRKTVRVIRLFRFVLALRTLITSIFSTLKSLFWALMLLTLIVYVFAILFAQAINDHLQTSAETFDEADLWATKTYYGDLANTMLSLFMSIVGGVSWEEVILPLKRISVAWVVLFVFYISFTYLAVQLECKWLGLACVADFPATWDQETIKMSAFFLQVVIARRPRLNVVTGVFCQSAIASKLFCRDFCSFWRLLFSIS